MAKDPAFLFYPNDWIGGTMGMTFEEKGAYMELLMMQFNRGHMTEHMIGQTVGQIWGQIKDKFEVDSDGKYYNKRLEDEQIKRKKFTESRRNNIEGKNQYTGNGHKEGHTTKHMTCHMENENENENENTSKNELVFPFDSENFKNQWKYWKQYKSKEFNFKYKSIQSEQAALKKLASLSGSNEQTAIAIIHQSFENGWKGLFQIKENGKEKRASESQQRSEYFRKHYPGYENL